MTAVQKLTAVEKLRTWGKAMPHKVTFSCRTGSWMVNVATTIPVEFEQGTAWHDTLEAAAAEAMGWLETIGEFHAEGMKSE